jgi:uncharacterized membrane protein YfcA
MNLSTTAIAVLLLIGVLAGMLSSMVGIGGGVVIVPALVFIPLFAMSQKMAQGTSLAMLLPPIGLFAVMNYYKSGYVDFKVAAILCVAFIGGSILGSKLVLGLDDIVLKRIFGGFLLLMAIKFLFFNK